MLKRTNRQFGRFLVGAGVWDSWGFGFSYCHYSRALSIELIHWYAYVEYWTKQEILTAKARKEQSAE
jgi:hypothetical protein